MAVLPATSSDVALVAAASSMGVLTHHALVDLAHDLSDDLVIRAVARTLSDLPVLDCRYVHGSLRDSWQSVDAPVEDDVHIESVADIDVSTRRWIARAMTPEGGRQVRVVLLRHSTGTRMLLSLTHAAVDGAGSMAVAATLGAHLTGRPPAPIERRRSLTLPLSKLPRRAKALLPFAVVRQSLRQVSMLAQPAHGAFSGDGPAGWTDIVLDSHHTAALKARSKTEGGSLNDALVTALARVAAHHTQGNRTWVAYTMNFRRYLGPAPRLIAGNLSGIAAVDLPTALALGPRALPAVVRQTQRHLDHLSAMAQFLGLATPVRVLPHRVVHQIAPWMTRALIRAPMRRALIVSNVGRIDAGLGAFGELVDTLRIVGPSIELAPIPTVTAFGLKGRLHLHVYAAAGQRAADSLARELDLALQQGA